MNHPGCQGYVNEVKNMSKLRKSLKDYESAHGHKVICPSIRYRCRYCPLPVVGRCKKLEKYLETGSWEKDTSQKSK
jgi:hypothetical protein